MNLSDAKNQLLYTCTGLGSTLDDDILIIDGPLTIFCVILGIVGNLRACSLLVNCNLNRRLVANMTVLFVSDTMLLVIALGYYSLHATLELFRVRFHGDFLIVHLHGLGAMATTITKWLTVLIAVNRFIAVYRPFYVMDGCQWSTIINIKSYYFYRIPILIILGAIFFNIPTLFEMKLIDCWNSDKGVIEKEASPTDLRLDHIYIVYYRLVFKIIFESFGPFLSILLLVILTQCTLKNASRQRPTLLFVNNDRIQRRIKNAEHTMHLISAIIIGKFLILHSLPVVLDLWERIYDINPMFDFLVKISNFLTIVNSSTNYLVYLANYKHKTTNPKSIPPNTSVAPKRSSRTTPTPSNNIRP